MALNQLQTKAESALAAVSSIDEIAHIRIITKAGGSRKATPAQAANLLAPLLAIDYSKLEEQIVPGEFWRSKNGSRKQVYTRTFVTDSKVATGLYGTYALSKLAKWYERVEGLNCKFFNSVITTMQNNYQSIVRYFDNRSTNAAAESFNAKVKAFRSQFRGVRDIPFFLFRLSAIFA